MEISSPPELAGMTLEKRLISYDWANQFENFQYVTRLGSFKPMCWANAMLPVSESIMRDEITGPEIFTVCLPVPLCGKGGWGAILVATNSYGTDGIKEQHRNVSKGTP